LAGKIQLTDNVDCLASYTISNAASSDNRGKVDSRGKLTEDFQTDEYALICSYGFQVGAGELSVLGGGYYEAFEYDLSAITFVAPGVTSPLAVKLKDQDIGWRAGLAYEIPEIAFRALLMYRSGASYSATGDANFSGVGVIAPATGKGELPQSLELKLQSGIAEDWLAFGSVKWVDWSVLERLDLQFGSTSSSNQYYWRDGWTVTAGVGHKFTDSVSAFTSLAWDRGVSTGWDLYGQTVTVAAGVSAKDKWGGDWRITAAAVRLFSEQETQNGALNASTQNTWGYGIQAQYKLTF
jgi:long-chain fatty acid transport protein